MDNVIIMKKLDRPTNLIGIIPYIFLTNILFP